MMAALRQDSGLATSRSCNASILIKPTTATSTPIAFTLTYIRQLISSRPFNLVLDATTETKIKSTKKYVLG